MEKKKKKKIILIPYPAQGHVTPMLKLASFLSNSEYFKPIIITPKFIHTQIYNPKENDHGISYISIPHGLVEEDENKELPPPKDFFEIEMCMEKYMPCYLEKIVLKILEEEEGVACLVVDLLASFAVDVGRRCGVPVAGFWPAMHSTYRLIQAIPHLIQTGVVSENGTPQDQNAPIFFSPNDPPLAPTQLPWLIGSPSSIKSRFEFWIRTLERSKTLTWLIINTFVDESQLESCTTQPITNHLFNQQKFFEIGSLIMQSSSISNPSFWEEDLSCLSWLDSQKYGSVVYILFGSWVSPIKEEKVKSLALALESAQRPFLWVLAPAWRHGLPDGYIDRMAGRGRVVSWAPQMEVLKHQGVGCYLTHCGWNSTMEGIQCKKPFLCYPIAGDQFLNCEYIVNVWKIGVKLEGFGVEEVEKGIRDVLEDVNIGLKIERLNEKVFGKDGSSRAMANLCHFIQDLDKSS